MEGQAPEGLTHPPFALCTEQCEQAMCLQDHCDQDRQPAACARRRRTKVVIPPRWGGWEAPEAVWARLRV